MPSGRFCFPNALVQWNSQIWNFGESSSEESEDQGSLLLWYLEATFQALTNATEMELIYCISVVGWRRKWQPTPVFLPGESCGQRRLVGCCPWGHTESDTTEATWHACMHWKGKWQPTPVSQGQRSLVGCRLWGCTELDTTEVIKQQQRKTK